MWKITLNDGQVVDNLILNSNTFESSDPIDSNIFKNNLQTVRIENPEGEIKTYENWKFYACYVQDGKTILSIGPKTDAEIEREMLMLAIAELGALIAGGK